MCGSALIKNIPPKLDGLQLKSKKKIIFINQVTGYLFTDVVNAFAGNYDCTLYTGNIENTLVPLHKSVRVKRMTRYDRNVAIKRIFTWSSFAIESFFKLLFQKRDTELFIVSNPPIAPFLGYLFHQLRGTKYHLLIYDVYPDVLVNFGMIKKNSFINRQWSRINKKLFSKAETVFTLSNNMATLINNYAPVKVDVIPNWAHTGIIQPIPKEKNPFAFKYDQTDKISVIYSGNMGATHAIERIADLAFAFKNDESFGFIAIGDGSKKTLIQQKKIEWELQNLLILPYQPADVLPYSLACADIGIVTLSAGAEDLSVPSKTYNLLAAGVALLVIASPKSELANLVSVHECGAHFQEHEIDKMKTFLLEMKNNPDHLLQLKRNARKASNHFTPANAQLYVQSLNNEYVPELVKTHL